MITTQHPNAKASITDQLTFDLFDSKEKTRSVLLHMNIFDAVIGQLKGEMSSYRL